MLKKLLVLAVVSLLGTTGVVYAKADKVSICHATDSPDKPYVLISVSKNAEQAHLGHGDFLLPVGDVDCSGGGGGPSPE